jgi:PAS domain S-box-containing protein
MAWEYHPYLLPLVLAAIIAAVLAVLAWQRRATSGSRSFVLLMAAVAWWSLGYAMELGAVELQAKIFWSNFNFVAVVTVPTAWLAFCLEYTGREDLLTRRNMALLTTEPVVILLLIWSDGGHHLFRSQVGLDTSGAAVMLAPVYGAVFWVNAIYSYVLLAVGTLLLVQAFFRAPRLYRAQTGAILVGAVLPWIGNALHIFNLSPIPNLDWTPFSFTLTGITIAWGLFRFGLLDVGPVARSAVFEDMQDGVLVVDERGRLADLNPTAQRILRWREEEVVGQRLSRVLVADVSNPAFAGGELAELLTGPLTEEDGIETEIAIGSEERRRYYDVRMTSLRRRRGRYAGRLIVLRDVTERRQAEEALATARDHALEMSRLKTELLANVSHDLRTPLNVILGYADMLLGGVHGSLSEGQSRATGRILTNAKQLASVVNDLLDQAELEAGWLELRIASFSPADLVDEVVSILADEARERGLALVTDVADSMPGDVVGDPQRTGQILMNLVVNALKFTEKGQVRIRLYGLDEEMWAIEVSDTGRGIPEEAQGYIFDPFRQVDGSPTREQGGVGLGLSLVHHLVEMMGGQIKLDTIVGRGSTFTVVLPIALTQEARA